MPRRGSRFEVFLSHSSADGRLGARIEKLLQKESLAVWFDRSDIRAGTLLRKELHDQIRESRILMLLWSKPASRSRWVAAELLTGFHEKLFIIPAVVDETALPYFLSNTLFLELKLSRAKVLAALPDAVRRAPRGATSVPPFRDSPSAEARALTALLARGQKLVTDALGERDLDRARECQAALDEPQRSAEKKHRLDATVLSLGGYHRKNAYMIEHWDEIQAGRPPKDPLLVKAERFFFDTLFVNPRDYNALNGLGSILVYERDYDAAEFFVRKALDLAGRAGVDYAAARHDLELIHWLKAGGG